MPVLFLLLIISLLVFLITVNSVRGQNIITDTAGQSWTVRSYVWNRQLNLWGRTDCTLDIGGLGSQVSGELSQSLCSNLSASNANTGYLSHVKYYHDSDPVDIARIIVEMVHMENCAAGHGLLYTG